MKLCFIGTGSLGFARNFLFKYEVDQYVGDTITFKRRFG